MFEGLEILTSISTALGASLFTYVTKSMKSGKNIDFDVKKFIRTFTIGVVVGITAYSLDFKLTQENYLQFLGANAGVIYISDQLAKFGYRLFEKFKNKEVI